MVSQFPSTFLTLFVLILYGVTGVKEAEAQLKKHLPKCYISLPASGTRTRPDLWRSLALQPQKKRRWWEDLIRIVKIALPQLMICYVAFFLVDSLLITDNK